VGNTDGLKNADYIDHQQPDDQENANGSGDQQTNAAPKGPQQQKQNGGHDCGKNNAGGTLGFCGKGKGLHKQNALTKCNTHYIWFRRYL